MLLYNTTYSIELGNEEDFLAWMKETHLPEVMATELPLEHKMLQLLTEVDNGAATFSVQYIFNNPRKLETFRNTYLDSFKEKIDDRYRGKYVFFESLLKKV